MGTWGTALYDGDVTCDVRDDYIDLLKSGKTAEEAQEKMLQSAFLQASEDERALFWYALADTQWNYGQLDPAVKESALRFCDREASFDRWEGTEEGLSQQWAKTIEALKEKLLTPQPPVKRVAKWRSYRCSWALGDVFAYRMHSDYSREHGLDGKYIAFRKVAEAKDYPHAIQPIVQFALKIWDECPTLEQVLNEKVMPSSHPIACQRRPNCEKSLWFELFSSSKRQIPSEHLFYLGNSTASIVVLEQPVDIFDRVLTSLGWQNSRMNNRIETIFYSWYEAWSQAPSELYEVVLREAKLLRKRKPIDFSKLTQEDRKWDRGRFPVP